AQLGLEAHSRARARAAGATPARRSRASAVARSAAARCGRGLDRGATRPVGVAARSARRPAAGGRPRARPQDGAPQERTLPMTMTNDRVTVRVTHRFTASPERVFDAWLDPAKAAKFLFATPTGRMVRAEIDPRVGGTFAFVDRRDGEDVEHTGT